MIIDGHCHYGSWAGTLLAAKYPPTTLADYKLITKQYGVKFIPTITCIKNKNDYTSKTRELAKIIRKNRKLFLGMTFWMWPKSKDETYALFNENRKIIKILKIHPQLDKMLVDSPAYCEYFKFAETVDIPIFVDPFGFNDRPQIGKIIKLVKRYHNTKFIIGHMGGYEGYRKAAELAHSRPNVWLETSGNMWSTFERHCAQAGYDKIIFGSDMRVIYFSSALGAIRDARIPAAAKNKILHDNILKLIR